MIPRIMKAEVCHLLPMAQLKSNFIILALLFVKLS